MTASTALAPTDDTKRLAEEMLAARDVMKEMLRETITAAQEGQPLESGRTVCGGMDNVKLPFERNHQSVELRSCPRGLVGLYHTHPTTDQLRDPSHSLPDMANVALGPVDVSIIVGTHTADVLIASDDEDEIADRFREAVGIDVSSPEQLLVAVRSGQVDPPAARERARRELGSLITREPTGFQTLAEQVDGLGLDGVTVSAIEGYETAREPQQLCTGPDMGKLRHRSRRVQHKLYATADGTSLGIDLRTLVISQTVGTLVGSVANEFIVKRLFGL